MRRRGLGTLARAGLVVVLALGGAIVILLIVAGSDNPGGQAGSGPGATLPDAGSGQLPAGRHASPGNPADPPTSGRHAPATITSDATPITNDQLLDAIERGDVVLLYPGRQPPVALRTIAAELAPPFTPALVAAGGAVILAPRRGVDGVIGVAFRHLIRSPSPADPALAQFVNYWLGRGGQ